MTNAAICGGQMTVSVLDVMASYYYITGSVHRFSDITSSLYTTVNAMPMFDNMWKKSI